MFIGCVEDGVYQSSVLFFLLGDVEFEVARSRSNFVGRVGSCVIEEIRGVVQVVQNWFIGIPNPHRISNLG